MTTKRDLAIEAIMTCLYSYGDTYTGPRPRETAAEWYDAGFQGPDEVSDWCDIGVWDPWVAAVLAKELTPQQCAKVVENCILPSTENPIHMFCNGLLNIEELLAVEWATQRGWRLMITDNGQECLVRNGPFPKIGPDVKLAASQNYQNYLDYVGVIKRELFQASVVEFLRKKSVDN